MIGHRDIGQLAIVHRRHKAEMIRASAETAPTRMETIKGFVANEELYPKELEKFGLKLNKEPLEAEGRVLPAPEMVGGDEKQIKVRLKRLF